MTVKVETAVSAEMLRHTRRLAIDWMEVWRHNPT